MRTHFGSSFVRSRVLARAGAVLAVAGLVLVGSAGVTGVTATSSAAVQSRDAEPFMAGTSLRYRDSQGTTGGCTAGLVLQDNSVLGGISEYRRSVRFILTAGHCGTVGERWTTTSGAFVGNAVWKSPTHDLMLIRVEPRLDRGVAPGCEPGSSTLPCVAISSHYYPRAVGKVFTGGPFNSDSIPVTGTAASDTNICISGGYNGTTCGHASTPQPPEVPATPSFAQGALFTRGPMGLLSEGDSGGAVFSNNGNVFGIPIGNWGGSDGVSRGVWYTPVDRFFAEQSGYALAPPE
ncbi:MAG TPA: trypsin-like serine protease [Kineosporiaceae bacterium]